MANQVKEKKKVNNVTAITTPTVILPTLSQFVLIKIII